MTTKETYDKRVKAGLCGACGARPAVVGVCCQECSDGIKQAKYNIYKQRRSAGLCTHCGDPAENGESLCVECKDKKRKYRKNTRIRALKQLCDGELHCQRCGETDEIVLEVHHVNFDGEKGRQTGQHFFLKILREKPKDLIVVCANCHVRLHREWEENGTARLK